VLQTLGVFSLILYLTFVFSGHKPNSNASSLVIALVFIVVNQIAINYSKRGRSVVAAGILVVQLALIGMLLMTFWGHDLPSALLLIILSVLLAGIGFGGRGFIVAGSVAILAYLSVALLQTARIYQVSENWKSIPYSYADIVMYAITMATIFAVTWLFNRQLHTAYLQTKASETKLRHQSLHLEELVAERTEALRQEYSQRLTDLHRFALYGKEASSLLHDILNPLSALSLQLETLKRGKKAEVKQAQIILKHLEELVTGARRQFHQQAVREAVSLHNEARAVFSSMAPRAKANNVTLTIKGPDQVVWTDPILIYKIMQNLVANALDASTTKGGTITIEITKEDAWLILTVSDTGSGIAPQDQSRIFEPYFTTKHEREGTGLGLSLIRELIEGEFGGSIDLVTSDGEGTVMQVKLPKRVLQKR
jgi:signal transduction histidine kinase